jgi:hypothetical protein
MSCVFIDFIVNFSTSGNRLTLRMNLDGNLKQPFFGEFAKFGEMAEGSCSKSASLHLDVKYVS